MLSRSLTDLMTIHTICMVPKWDTLTLSQQCGNGTETKAVHIQGSHNKNNIYVLLLVFVVYIYNMVTHSIFFSVINDH